MAQSLNSIQPARFSSKGFFVFCLKSKTSKTYLFFLLKSGKRKSLVFDEKCQVKVTKSGGWVGQELYNKKWTQLCP